MPVETHYMTLDVEQSATQEEIREAYRILASVWHPDRFTHGSKQWERANEKLKAINAAYAVLKDPHQRSKYDQWLEQQRSSAGAQSPPPPRFTLEQERTIERNRERYRLALNSQQMQSFCAGLGLEGARRKALADLEWYRPETARDLLRRYNAAAK